MNEREKLVKLLQGEGTVQKTADLGQIPDNVSAGNDVLPKDVSNKIIEEIVDANTMRKFVKTINVANRSITIPRIIFGSSVNAYKATYGADVTLTGSAQDFSTKSTSIEPQLLVTRQEMLELDLDTAGVDVANYVRKALALCIARAEEQTMLIGEKASGSGYLTLFDGVYTIAGDAAKCATSPITYDNSDDLTDKIADAIKDLGVYGQDRGALVLIASNTFANKLRKSSKIQQVGTYTLDEKGVTRTGVLPLIHGVRVVESSVLETKEGGDCAVLMRVDGGLLGQRGNIMLRLKDEVEKFAKLLIMAEVIDFKWVMYNASDKAMGVVLIHASNS